MCEALNMQLVLHSILRTLRIAIIMMIIIIMAATATTIKKICSPPTQNAI